MRKIRFSQVAVFLLLFSFIILLAVLTTAGLLGNLELGDFRGVVLLVAGIIILYIYALAVYRTFMWVRPLREGEIAPGSQQEFVYHVYLLFFIILFHPLMRGSFIPIPLMQLVYLALGVRLGKNSYITGIVFDPHFVSMGNDTLVGQGALIVPHIIENERLGHYPIRIGSNVTIGAHSVVLAGVTIDDGALVATGSVVKKGTHIAAHEVWGGVPARRLKGADKS